VSRSDAVEKASPAYVVLRQTGEGRWEIVGEATRQPGLTARAARAQAVRDALRREPEPDEVFAAILRSEWKIAFEL
jgi:hypothetical protein